MKSDSLSIYTLAVQGGYQPREDEPTPAIPAIIPAVGFTHPTMQQADHALGSSGGSMGQPDDYIYARHGAPTQAAFEAAVASIEGAEESLSFSSGMAALHAAFLATVTPGGTVVTAEQLYGATHSLLRWLAENLGVTVRTVDFLDLGAAKRVIEEMAPQAVVCEVLTNPLARVVRVDEIAASAAEVGAVSIVDNTFATPYLLRPLEMGVSLVVHSATKFINGHGDVVGGLVSGPHALVEKIRTHRKVMGAVMGPFEAWLALRGMKTLALRMSHGCRSAAQIAHWLNQNPRIKQVYYPGLPSDPCYVDACVLFRHDNFGAMLAFEVDGLDREGAYALVECLRIIRPVTSLGDVNTLISHPATSSHRALSSEERAAQGILEGTLRLSVGIEDPDDLIADLSQALQAVH